MNSANNLNKKGFRISKQMSKVKKTVLILGIAGALTWTLDSCKQGSVWEGSQTEKNKTKSKLAQFQEEWRIFMNINYDKSRLIQGPILLEKWSSYSILLSKAFGTAPGIFTLSKLNDDWTVWYSYNLTQDEWVISWYRDTEDSQITATEEYNEIYDILINTLNTYNNRGLNDNSGDE
jgi:hypothetical protein